MNTTATKATEHMCDVIKDHAEDRIELERMCGNYLDFNERREILRKEMQNGAVEFGVSYLSVRGKMTALLMY